MNSFSRRKGQLLLEILMAIAVAVVVVSLGAGLVYVSLRGNEVVVERDVALGLAEETIEAVRGAAYARWNDVYGLDKGENNIYYPKEEVDSGVSYKWIDHTPAAPDQRWLGRCCNAVSVLSPINVWIVGVSTTVWNWDGLVWKEF